MNNDLLARARRLIPQALGALSLLAGISLVAMTAQGLLKFREAAARHGGEAIELGPDAHPQSGQQGFMGRIVGTPRVVEAPHDPDFNLLADTPVLLRHVEMFQWREIRIGDTLHYEMDWVDRPVDSSHFEQSARHENPSVFPIVGKQFDAGLVQVGGFKLSSDVFHAIPGSAMVTPQLTGLPANLAATFSLQGDYLVTSLQPDDPRLGDVRVSWTEVPLQLMTIVAKIDGDRLVAATGAADGKGLQVAIGDVPLLDLYPDLPIPPEFVLLRWVVAWLLAAGGAYLLGTAREISSDPLLAAALATLSLGAVAGLMWIGSDTTTLLTWLGLALIGGAGVAWRLRRQRLL